MMAVIAMAAAAEPTDLGDNLVQGYQVELEMTDVVAWQDAAPPIWERGMSEATEEARLLGGGRPMSDIGALFTVHDPSHATIVFNGDGLFQPDTHHPAEGTVEAAWVVGRSTRSGKNRALWTRTGTQVTLVSCFMPRNDTVVLATVEADLAEYGLGDPAAWTIVPIMNGTNTLMRPQIPMLLVIGEDRETMKLLWRLHTYGGVGSRVTWAYNTPLGDNLVQGYQVELIVADALVMP